MKQIKGLVAIMVSLVLLSFKPMNMDDVATAVNAGNAALLSKYLDNQVDICLPDKSDTYSKRQAEMVIRDFFNTNSVQNFQVKHRGENGDSEFCIGLLKTKNGVFRTVLFMKQKGDKELLQEIRFESSE